MGALGWLAAAPPLSAALGHPLTPTETLAGVLLCGGAALLPDCDHPSTTVARTLGPVTRAMASGICKAAGGHREGTHSAPFALLAGLGAAVLVSGWRWGVFVVFLLCSAWAIRLLGPKDLRHTALGLGPVLAAGLAAWWLAGVFPGSTWMAVAVGCGALLHVVPGDLVTDGSSLPVLWPVPLRVPCLCLFRTGGAVEKRLVSPVLMFATCWAVWVQLPR